MFSTLHAYNCCQLHIHEVQKSPFFFSLQEKIPTTYHCSCPFLSNSGDTDCNVLHPEAHDPAAGSAFPSPASSAGIKSQMCLSPQKKPGASRAVPISHFQHTQPPPQGCFPPLRTCLRHLTSLEPDNTRSFVSGFSQQVCGVHPCHGIDLCFLLSRD